MHKAGNTSSILSNSVIIVHYVGKMSSDSLETLAHGDQAIDFASKYDIDVTEFADLKHAIDRREQEIIAEDGAYVDQMLDKIGQLRITVANKSLQLVETSREQHESLFGNVQTGQLSLSLQAAGAGVHANGAVHQRA